LFPIGAKPRTSAQVEEELKRTKAKRLIPKNHSEMGSAIVAWWMKQKEFKPLNFPDKSLGYLAQTAFGRGLLSFLVSKPWALSQFFCHPPSAPKAALRTASLSDPF
jgi:hypothetical protein